MATPFPGVDPCVEATDAWESFHPVFLVEAMDALNNVLPNNDVARIEGRSVIRSAERDEPSREYRPDILIAGRPVHSERMVREPVFEMELETRVVTLANPTSVVEIKERWLEVRRPPDRDLVAVIELLSPSNKTGSGRDVYEDKRLEILAQPIHLIEIDLLMRGTRLRMESALPPGDHLAHVSRADRRPSCDVHPWTVRQAAPAIPIPLVSPDTDAAPRLNDVIHQSHRRPRCDKSIRYGRPLALPFDATDREWAEGLR